MQKVIVFIICLLSITSVTNAFFWSPSSLDLYKNIDKWIKTTEDKLLNFELEWWKKETGISAEINHLAQINNIKPCLDETLYIGVDEFHYIINYENIQSLTSFFSDDCKQDWNFKAELVQDYLKLFKKHKTNSIETSEKKAERIYKLSSSSTYTDWTLENSPFDLIIDIENIDKIIFASKTDYEWEENIDLWESVNEMLEDLSKSMDDLKYDNEKQREKIEKTLNNNNDDGTILDTETQYNCPEDSDNNWLSSATNNFLLKDLQNDLNSDTSPPPSNITYWSWSTKKSKNNNIWDSYSEVNDNWEWPCDWFFCIIIEFVMYNHSLFGWSDNITIEYLLNRSNNHLKKFASTSLIPANMSIANFELNLTNLDLPDMFHLGFQVTTKPIPILNLEKEDKDEDNNTLDSNDMLEKYYKSYWLNYERRNDLSLLRNLEQNKQITLTSEQLLIQDAIERQKELRQNFINKEKHNSSYISKEVDKKVSYGIMQDFEKQFSELSRFTESFYNYIRDITPVIKGMDNIPNVN